MSDTRGNGSHQGSNIEVMVRFRPLNDREMNWMQDHNVTDVAIKYVDENTVSVLKPKYTNVHVESEVMGRHRSSSHASHSTPQNIRHLQDTRDRAQSGDDVRNHNYYTPQGHTRHLERKKSGLQSYHTSSRTSQNSNYADSGPSSGHSTPRQNTPRRLNQHHNDSKPIQCDWYNHHRTSHVTFDHIFNETSTQNEVYDRVGPPVVSALLDGFNVTVMAYGQTSSGKTYTMTGPDSMDAIDTDEIGLVPRILSTLFEHIEQKQTAYETKVTVSYVQIYMERVQDLLEPTKNNLKIREQQVYNPNHTQTNTTIFVEDCTLCEVSTLDEIQALVHLGNQNRATATTDMNDCSSRSHAVLMVHVDQEHLLSGEHIQSKLYCVDLAGSEQIRQTHATGDTLEEAKHVNLSLSTLSLVINALTTKQRQDSVAAATSAPTSQQQHIPYRNSKLTRLLSDSLGGNSKTILLLNATTSLDSVWSTYSTLMFGARAKQIKNHVRKNRSLSLAAALRLIRKLQTENELMANQRDMLCGILAMYNIHVTDADIKTLEDIESMRLQLEQQFTENRNQLIADLKTELQEQQNANSFQQYAQQHNTDVGSCPPPPTPEDKTVGVDGVMDDDTIEISENSECSEYEQSTAAVQTLIKRLSLFDKTKTAIDIHPTNSNDDTNTDIDQKIESPSTPPPQLEFRTQRGSFYVSQHPVDYSLQVWKEPVVIPQNFIIVYNNDNMFAIDQIK